MNNVYLSQADLQNLPTIGYGTDGTVYAYQNNFLIKIYHNANTYQHSNPDIQDDDVKIYYLGQKENWQNDWYRDHLKYYQYESNEDKTILAPKDAIILANKKQEQISLTKLPCGLVYIDNHFAGCVLKRSTGIQIHKLTGLPLKLRKIIFLNVLKAEAELLKNNIYHCDLSNSPYSQKMYTLPNGQHVLTGHSHVLVNPVTLKTNFIDLDGKSTIYTNNEEEKLKKQSERELNRLMIEFLLQIDLDDYKDDPSSMISDLEQKGINNYFLQEKIYETNMNLDDMLSLNKNLKK